MASIINASTSGAGGLISTADASGVLQIQSGGTTVTTVSSTGEAVIGTLSATGNISSSAGTISDSVGTLRPLVSGTAVNSTSGTSIDFTGIPSWVKRITVMLNGVSTNGTSFVQVQIGNGSILTTGYTSTSSTNGANGQSTTGFLTTANNGASDFRSGIMYIANISANTWIMGANIGISTPNCHTSAGVVSLSGTLDRIRITTANGTDTFDAGSINILYE